jgi:hypothetical protein
VSRGDEYEPMLPGESAEEYHRRIETPELAAMKREGRLTMVRRARALLSDEPYEWDRRLSWEERERFARSLLESAGVELPSAPGSEVEADG